MKVRRNTIQKDLVLRAVNEMKRHATTEEVYEFIKKEHPTIGKGTVYRNLGILVGIKLLSHDIFFKGICSLCLEKEEDCEE